MFAKLLSTEPEDVKLLKVSVKFVNASVQVPAESNAARVVELRQAVADAKPEKATIAAAMITARVVKLFINAILRRLPTPE
jgi:hypothetical protein